MSERGERERANIKKTSRTHQKQNTQFTTRAINTHTQRLTPLSKLGSSVSVTCCRDGLRHRYGLVLLWTLTSNNGGRSFQDLSIFWLIVRSRNVSVELMNISDNPGGRSASTTSPVEVIVHVNKVLIVPPLLLVFL